MAVRWICQKGHTTEALTPPRSCPVCGDTFMESGSTHAGNGATFDLPNGTTFDLPIDAPGGIGTIAEAHHQSASRSSGNSAVRIIEIPGYEIVGELGRGGMGVVYKARQRGLNRLVALKMILAAEHAGPMDRQRFQVEAEAVAQLQHPNIVQIYEVGEVEGRPYFSLEYVDGGSLAQKLDGKPQAARASAAMLEAIARAVAAAHEVGIIHRDLKPANVLLATQGELSGSKMLSSLAIRAQHPFGIPKITDFGLAKRLEGGSGNTQSGSILGTPSYMAPEQAAGRINEIGPHTDVYALGAILYEMLTGRPPFLSDSPFETIMQVLRDEPIPPRSVQPKLPRDIEIICLKCLEKKPEKRYSNATELADDLQRFVEGEPIAARPATRWERSRKWMRRHPAATGFIAIAAVAVSAMIGGAWVYHGKVEDALAATANERDVTGKERDKLAAEQKRGLVREIRLMVSSGTQHVDQGDYMRALPWFTEALRLEKDNPEREEMHRIRLAAVLRQCPHLTRAWFHDGRVNDAAFSPDGLRVLTACGDGWARVFLIADLKADKPELELPHAPGAVLSARYSSTSEHIVTVCSDHAARIWDAKSGKPIGLPLYHAAAVTGAIFSPDGLRVLTTSADRTARVWDVLTGEAAPIVFKHSAAVLHAEFSFDGRLIATAGADGAARVWDADTGKPVSPVLAHQGAVVRAVFSPDGKLVLTASHDQTARVWEAETGRGVTPFMRVKTALADAKFSPSGRDILTASKGGAGRVWNLEINDWRTYVVNHQSPIVEIAISPDGRALATGGEDNTARVWDIVNGDPLTPPLRHNGAVHRVAFSSDGSTLLTASQDGLVRLWDIAASRRFDVDPIVASKSPNLVVNSSDRRRRLKIEENGVVRIVVAGVGDQAGLVLQHSGSISAAIFSPDGSLALTASADRTARLWKAATGEPIGEVMRHGSDVYCVAFSPDGKFVATGSEDNTARVWKAESGEAVTPPLHHLSGVEKTLFSPDSRCLLTQSIEGVARIWDAGTGEALAPAAKPSGWIARALSGGDIAAGWDLPPDSRSVERLIALAQWASAHRIDSASNLVPLDIDALHAIWDEMRSKYAKELRHSTDALPWHRKEADSAEKAHDWFAASFHLNRLIEAAEAGAKTKPVPSSLYGRRGRAFAEQGQWSAAGDDFHRATHGAINEEGLLIAHALCHLAAGDRKGYLEARKHLIELCGESANGESASRMAWACLLIPVPLEEERQLESLLKNAGSEGRPSAGLTILRGAALTRSGKWEEAVEALTEGTILAEGIDVPKAWLFLALAEQKAGRTESAKRWLRQVRLWQERYGDVTAKAPGVRSATLTWQQRLELKLLRDEAEKAMPEPDGKKIEKIQE